MRHGTIGTSILKSITVVYLSTTTSSSEPFVLMKKTRTSLLRKPRKLPGSPILILHKHSSIGSTPTQGRIFQTLLRIPLIVLLRVTLTRWPNVFLCYVKNWPSPLYRSTSRWKRPGVQIIASEACYSSTGLIVLDDGPDD